MNTELQTSIPGLKKKRSQEKTVTALTILLVGMFIALAFFARSSSLLRFDENITHELQENRNNFLDLFWYAFTFLGNTITMVSFCLIAVWGLYRQQRRRAAFFSLLSLLGLPLNLLLKYLVHRPRPTANLVRIFYPQAGPSFPSGHAMGSVIIYGFLAYLVWRYMPDRRGKRFWVIVFALVPVFISLSRVYLGVHWFSDVVGAWLFGLVTLRLLIAFYQFEVDSMPAAPEAQ